MQAVFARGRKGSDKRSELPLYINNCGYYRDLTSDIPLDRPSGRRDYHIVLTVEGEVASDRGVARAGEGFLYRPDEPQRYVYRKGKGTAYLWVHFSGADVEGLLSEIEPQARLSYRENAGEVHELLFRAVRAIADGRGNADLYAEGLFRAAVALLLSTEEARTPFSVAIAMMKEPSRSYTVKEYAAASGMSEGHFIRSFKRAFGVTPLEYRTELQIDCARSLLASTPMRIGMVAEAVGFSDALYFSRVFKKRTGVSPSQYREERI